MKHSRWHHILKFIPWVTPLNVGELKVQEDTHWTKPMKLRGGEMGLEKHTKKYILKNVIIIYNYMVPKIIEEIYVSSFSSVLIDYSWLNLSFESIKIKYKGLFMTSSYCIKYEKIPQMSFIWPNYFFLLLKFHFTMKNKWF